MQILAAVDRSEYAEIVVEHALDQAVRRGADALHFVSVVAADSAIDDTRRWLAAYASDMIATFGCRSRAMLHVKTGTPELVISRLAREIEPDLLVVGRFSVPSAADRILELVDCPTLVVGIAGHDLEPQCPSCMRVRRQSGAERLFCVQHAGDRAAELVSRLPLLWDASSRLW